MENVKPTLRAEFEMATKPFLIYLATTIIWLSFAKDIVRVGFRLDWLVIRLGYLPFVWGASELARRLPNRFYEISLWASALYITGFCTYFSISTGHLGSDSIYGLVQFYFGIAIMPITAFSFYVIISSSMLYYILGNLVAGGAPLAPPPMIVSNVTPLLIFASLVFFITHRIRKQKLRLQGELIDTLSKQKSIINQQSKALAEAQTKAALGKLASSVAHDIRSPLAALSIVARSATTLSEEMRMILRNATSRIETIAGSLLAAYKDPEAKPSTRTSELLSALIENVVCEKRLEWQQKSQVEIRFEPNETAYGHFALVEASLFSRILSNILNNASEAINGKGHVTIALGSSDKNVFVDVIDSGSGISKEMISKLLAGTGVTTKTAGHGIGLSGAIQILKQWGGQLSIESNIGLGTQVRLEIPKAPTPSWFVRELDLSNIKRVVVVDDDSSIHQLWEHKFFSLIHSTQIELFHFYKPADVSNEELLIDQDTLFLVDYEFIGSAHTGLDMIERIRSRSTCILVTSRFEEPHVGASCERMNVGLVPKGLASIVPVKSGSTTRAF